MDPFAGTGTTGAAAHALGCDYVMFDNDAPVVDLFDRQIKGRFQKRYPFASACIPRESTKSRKSSPLDVKGKYVDDEAKVSRDKADDAADAAEEEESSDDDDDDADDESPSGAGGDAKGGV